ncbi:MAG: response regulator [Deltaproteobacteria bacterium]|nr:response regulator [Deltaproteobacteria bacterium]
MIDGKKRLLLVDDEVEFLDAAAKTLERRGFFVCPVQDGETALMILKRQSFDVVILDVKMPGIDGIELLLRIKKRLPQLPVVLLTGQSTNRQASEMIRKGAFECLCKPCAIDKIAEVARAAVNRH